MDADSEPNLDQPSLWRGRVVNLLLIVAIFVSVQWWRARPMASGVAPALAGQTLDGRPVDLAQLRGRPVLVHFWASWCAVCTLEQASIDAIARDHPVVGVAMQSGGANDIRRFMAEQGLSFPTVVDESGEISARWGVPAVPATFVLDESGRIAFSTLGLTSEAGLRARLWGASLGRGESVLAAP